MPWRQIITEDVLAQFTPGERATLQNIQGATANLAAILSDSVSAARGAIRSGNYEVSTTEGEIPDQIRNDVIAITRWNWLISFPQLKVMQTDVRKASAEAAQNRLDDIATQKFNVESPTVVAAAGNWNSEPKILGRAHPIPKPATQFQGTSDSYANPDGPQDS